MARGIHGLPKVSPGLPSPTFLRLAGGPPQNGLTVAFRVARLQGGQPAAVLYPLGYPTPYGLFPLSSSIADHML
jgi:hypothetical protein